MFKHTVATVRGRAWRFGSRMSPPPSARNLGFPGRPYASKSSPRRNTTTNLTSKVGISALVSVSLLSIFLAPAPMFWAGDVPKDKEMAATRSASLLIRAFLAGLDAAESASSPALTPFWQDPRKCLATFFQSNVTEHGSLPLPYAPAGSDLQVYSVSDTVEDPNKRFIVYQCRMPAAGKLPEARMELVDRVMEDIAANYEANLAAGKTSRGIFFVLSGRACWTLYHDGRRYIEFETTEINGIFGREAPAPAAVSVING
ncbi:hypothetical protein F4780DRAFT_735397 [Xylariomycetidae sp. FL0641]|nr:hypothetical protein F4780DRAFT_735397 [Xylariomycetidae sp. FL0641]